MITAEELAKEIHLIDDIRPDFAMMIATGLLPFLQAQITAAAEMRYYDIYAIAVKVTGDQPTASEIAKRLATPQPPKDAGALGNPRDLISFAEGRIQHANQGRCPGPQRFNSRDPDCAVCNAINASLTGKDAGAMPIPHPGVADADGKPFAYWPDQLREYGNAREAAALSDADKAEQYRKGWEAGQAAGRANAAPVCTCPSGDGSLRHPCPQHPPAEPAARGQVEAPAWFGQLPAYITNPEAWPENYVGGYNDALAMGYDVIRGNITHPSPAHAGAGDAEALAKLAIDTVAKKLYGLHADNHPTMHCNRFPAWSELKDADREEWREKARRLAGGDHA